MEVRILGPLEVVHAGVPVGLGGTKQRAVFAMLALRVNRVVSIDFLVDGLWGTAPPTDPTNVVHVYISRLRKALRPQGETDGQDGAVLRRRPGYLLQLDPEQLDLHRFERLAREGSRALPAAPDLAAVALSDALQLWRGLPLAEFTEEPFAQHETPRLTELRLNALSARIQADLALGRHAQLVGELEDLTAQHPLHEGLRGQLILSLYRSGRQAEALTAYRRTRGAFVDELGIDPGRELQELEAAVLAHAPHLDWAPPPTADPGMPIPLGTAPATAAVAGPVLHGSSRHPTVWNMPARNPHFTGRSSTLTLIRDRLRAGNNTLVVQALYGLGGVGKTQLAIEYAHRCAADYTITWLIHAEQPVLIPSQLADLAGRLGLRALGEASHIAQQVLTELGGRSDWLLIFDNAGHPEDIARYLPTGKGPAMSWSPHAFPAGVHWGGGWRSTCSNGRTPSLCCAPESRR